MENFYKNAGIVVNKLCYYVKDFEKTANYITLTDINNPRNGKNLKRQLKELFKTYSNRIPLADKMFSAAMAEVVGTEDFVLDVKEYRENNYDVTFNLYCLDGNRLAQ